MDLNSLIAGLDISKKTADKIEKILAVHDKHDPEPVELEAAAKLSNEVLADIFKTPYNFLIPFDFIESELGALLFEAKFIHQRYYSVLDIGIILDRSNSSLYYNKGRGNIKMIYRGGTYMATEGELIKFMKSKRMTSADIDKRLDIYWEIKRRYFSKKITRARLQQLYMEELQKRLNK